MKPHHRNHPLLACAAGLALLSLRAPVRADVANLPAQKDAMILGGFNINNSSGAGPAMFAGTDGNGSPKRSLIAFDFSTIPAGSLITNVTLTLYLAQVAGAGGGGGATGDTTTRTIRLYALTSNWGEGLTGAGMGSVGGTGQGFPAQTGDATWNYAFYNETLWNTPGGDFVGNQETTPGAQESADSLVGETLNAGYTWNASGMISDVQGWLDGATANDGWLLKNDAETTPRTFRGFWTKDGAAVNNTPTLAPSLTVAYTPPSPLNGSWIINTSGNWQSSPNWSGAIPNAIDAAATFATPLAAPVTITLTSPVTLGTLNFSSAQAYTLTGSPITLQTSTGSAAINLVLGSHEIAAPLILSVATAINVARPADLLTLSGNLTGTGGLTSTGAGTVLLSASNAYTGGTTVNNGVLIFASPAARPAAGQLTINPNAATAQGALIVVQGDAANLLKYRSALASSFVNGIWTNAGPIASTAAAANPNQGLGYATGSEYLSLHAAADLTPNYTVHPTDILLRYTAMGDANLDGQITVADYALLNASFLLQPSTVDWFHGDFNYDGIINYLDYAFIDAAFMAQSGPLAAANSAASTQLTLDIERFGPNFLTAYNADLPPPNLAAVPEPSTMSLLAIAALLGRRRSRPR